MFTFHLITTGGTIDAQPYDVAHTPDVVTPLPNSLVPQMLRYLGYHNFVHTALPPLDSKEFLSSEVGLSHLISHIIASKQPTLITYGTDALALTAVAVYEATKHQQNSQKIAFSCAMTPLSNTHQPDGNFRFDQCDGTANTQQALRILEDDSYSAGVYISANRGQLVASNQQLSHVRKEYDTASADQRYFVLDA